MNVTITEISPDTLDALTDLAQKNGKTLEQFARSILERETVRKSKPAELSKGEKIKIFEEWMENLNPNIPILSDEQISRESIYEEQILRQL